ncbi:MAG: hypothetical protein H3C62_06975 [Gemmatimonadaceae bacterium]|nr:hypothetical protein [Gemmatimonadaceae bacterium]
MSEVLYERTMPEGATVRIRRLTPAEAAPVRAVIEVDRRNSGPRSIDARRSPPALMAVEGETEQGVVAALLPFVEEDAAIARLLAQRGAP